MSAMAIGDLVFLHLLAALLPWPAYGTLSISHSIIIPTTMPPTVRVTPVHGVAVLSLTRDPDARHGFRCFTSTGSPSDLRWVKGGNDVRFDVSPTSNNLQMDMSSPPVTRADQGYYNCTNSDGSENIAIFISADSLAIVPSQTQYIVREGASVTMAVDAVAFKDMGSEFIEWTLAGSLRGTGRNLSLSSVGLQDGGLYTVNYTKMDAGSVTTEISLTVQVLPRVLQSPVSVATSEHSRAVFVCEFTGSPRPLNLRWRKREGDLPILSRHVVMTTTSDNATVPLFNVRSELIIFYTFVRDSGAYVCEVDSPISSDILTTQYAQLTVTHGLSLSATIGSQSAQQMLDSRNRLLSVSESSRVVIKCNGTGILEWTSSTGHPIALFSASGSNPVIYQRKDITISSQFLTIQTFTSTHRALYTCTTQLPDNTVLQESVFITSANLDVYVPMGVVYGSRGDTVDLPASVLSQSSPQWTFNNVSIVLTTPPSNSSTPYYSQPSGGSSLRVHNIDESVLGEYTVLVTDGITSRLATVTLTLTEPPSVVTRPSALSVWETVGVVLECEVGGRWEAVLWRRCGQPLLPLLNATQNGTSLVISSVARIHAGCYACTAINGDTSSTNTTILTVLYGPTSSVEYNNTVLSADSLSGVISLEVEEGSPTHLLSCSGAGLPMPETSWYREDVGAALRRISWMETFHYTDSGSIVCVADNSRTTSRTTVSFTVTRAPVLTTVVPIPPVSTSSVSSFFIPHPHTGPALTCVGTGWPHPSLIWRRHDGIEYRSNPSTASLDATVSATLEWEQMSLQTGGAEVSCTITGERNSSHTFRIDTVSITASQFSSQCVVDSNVTGVQLRVMELPATLCEQHTHIGSRFRDQLQVVLETVIESMCEMCGHVQRSEVMMTAITCSEQAQSVVFMGQIATATTDRTRSMVCALAEWQRSRPLVFLEESFHEVDPNCSVISPASNTVFTREGHCTVAGSPLTSAIVIATAIAAATVVLVILAVVVLIVVLCCRRGSNKHSSTHDSLEKIEVTESIHSDSKELSTSEKQHPV